MNTDAEKSGSEIRRLYFSEKSHDELAGEWGAFILYRWISFPVTSFFIRTGISANNVSVLCILLSFSLCFVFLKPDGISYIYLSIIAIIISILDCVDGNIARITNSRSFKGQYLDFIADLIYRVCLYVSLGYIIQSTTVIEPVLFKKAVLLCLLSALLAIFSRLCRVYVEKRFNSQIKDNTSVEMTKVKRKYHFRDIIFSFFSGLDPLLPVFILIAGFSNVIHWLLIWILFYSILDFTNTQYRILTRVE